MPEKTQKRKLRSDQSTSHVEIKNYNYPNDENASLFEQDFEDIPSKVENRLSKRQRDTEFGQREILRLIENLTSKVDSLSNPASEQCSSALRYELDTDPVDNSGNDNANRNAVPTPLFQYESDVDITIHSSEESDEEDYHDCKYVQN